MTRASATAVLDVCNRQPRHLIIEGIRVARVVAGPRPVRVAWHTVGASAARVSVDAEARTDRLAGLTRIGIDELSYMPKPLAGPPGTVWKTR